MPELDDEVGGGDLERHGGGEAGPLDEQRTGQGHRRIGAGGGGGAEAGGEGQGAWSVIPQQANDRRAAHQGLDDRRQGEAQDQGPEDLPGHGTRDGKRVHYGVQ